MTLEGKKPVKQKVEMHMHVACHYLELEYMKKLSK